MKEIKYILNALLWALYTSSWWAAIKWGHDKSDDTCFGLLWGLPFIFTFVLIIVSIAYCIDHWRND